MRAKMIKKCALLLLGTLLCTTIQGQSKDTLFKPLYETTKVKSLRSTFTRSDSIALDGLGTIYSLAIDATVTQPRESSFARVVLEDKEGHQYLVAECDRFRYDQDEVRLEHFCQETASLEGIVPRCLRCYVSGDAVLQLTGIHSTSIRPARRSDTKGESALRHKEQVQDVVDRINAYNKKHQKLWVAGITNRSLIPYNSSEESSCADPYVSNIRYYIGGIYEMGERENHLKSPKNTPKTFATEAFTFSLMDSFDWTNYQGKNYMTPVKNQGDDDVCTAFAATAVMEAYFNAYYNQIINIDLSEAQIIDTLGIRHGYYTSNAYDVLGKITEFGIINDSLWEFHPSDPSVPFPYPMNCERTYIGDTLLVHIDSTNLQPIKENIITHGPGVSGYSYPVLRHDSHGTYIGYKGHAMALCGYGTVHVGDSISQIDSLLYQSGIVSSNTHPLIGETFWIFKNSDGIDSTRNDRHNGYIKILFNNYDYMSDVCFIDGPIIRSQHVDTVAIADKDGDGYFYWGISDEAPDCLIEGMYYMPYQKDADDTNSMIGPMIDYDHYIKLSPFDENAWNITSNETIDQLYNGRCINIRNHGVLTVNNILYNHKDVCIWIEDGGTLIVNGGIIQNGIIAPETGGTVTIKNGGCVIHSDDDYFEVPLGAKFNLLHGEIKYRDN